MVTEVWSGRAVGLGLTGPLVIDAEPGLTIFAAPVTGGQLLLIWVGVDTSTKRDSSAVVAVTFDTETKRYVVNHKVFVRPPWVTQCS